MYCESNGHVTDVVTLVTRSQKVEVMSQKSVGSISQQPCKIDGWFKLTMYRKLPVYCESCGHVTELWKEGCYVFASVCLSARLLKKLLTGSDKIFWRDEAWPMNNQLDFGGIWMTV